MNTISPKKKNIILVILLIVFVIIIIIVAVRYFKNFVSITEFPHDAKKKFKVSGKKVKFSQAQKGLSFTHSFWIYVNDWNYRFMNEKNILEKGGLLIYLGARNNNLYIEIPVLNSTRPERIVYENIPIQKWVNISILLENRHLDVWLNGKLYHSRYLKNIPDFKAGSDITYLDNGGFSGHISRIYHYKYNLSKAKIKSLFSAGPINKNILYKIVLFFKNSVDKILTRKKTPKKNCLKK